MRNTTSQRAKGLRRGFTLIKLPVVRKRAFTLIELLAVMFILAMLVALVVGVGAYVVSEGCKKHTQATQAVLMSALQAYFDNSDPKAYPPDGGGGDASKNILFQYLTGRVDTTGDGDPDHTFHDTPLGRAVLKITRQVSDDAMPSPDSALSQKYFKDGWSRLLRYDRDGGFGGGPVVISGGGDGNFATTNDNIYSDR